MQRGEVRIRGLTWRPLGRREPTVVGLDLHLEPGERVLIVGPSGAGKSTLLLALAGALGTTLAGDLSGFAEVGGRLGLLLQNPANSVVAERIGRDVAFGPENAGASRRDIWHLVDEALESVGLPHDREHHVAELSGGEKQRLALAGALATRPDVLLLDEPTAMLDASTAQRVRESVVAAVGERTMVVVEHQFGPWIPHVDRVVVMGRGGVITSDTSVAEFLAGPAPEGVWFPGAPAPVPRAVPLDVATPATPAPRVVAERLVVDLSRRGLRTGSSRLRVVDGLSAAFEPGTTTALTGPSGSGKSTALAAIAGLRKLSAGRVTPELRRRRPREFVALVGWASQSPELGFVTHRVADEVEFAARRLGRVVDTRAVLEHFDLALYADAHPFRLSGGEQRRLALAAALAHRPAVLLLDEPTVGQDPANWAAVVGWLGAVRTAGGVVVAATHDPGWRCDQVLDVKARR